MNDGSSRRARINEPKWRPWLRVLKTVAVTACLAWVVVLLKDAWSEFAAELHKLDLFRLTAGFTSGILANLLTYSAFSGILSGISQRVPSGRNLAHLYFSAQMMKHLPGRFFGIVYQVATTRGQIPATRWIAANTLHMMLIMFLAIMVSVAVLLANKSVTIAAAWTAGGILFGTVAWRPNWISSFGNLLRRSHFPFAEKICIGLSLLADIEPQVKLKVSFTLLLSWLLYLAAWAFYASAYPDLSPMDGIRMCAFYTVAWLAGYLSLVTPSGLGVRELVFAALSTEFSSGAVAYGLILGRVSLLAIDLILGLVFLRGNQRYYDTA